MARPKGQPKLGGRKKGTPNKLTVVAKDAIAQAFDRVGGVDGLVKWIEANGDNRKVFYSVIHPKLIPVQVSGEGGGPIQTESKLDIAGLNADQLRALASIKIPAG